MAEIRIAEDVTPATPPTGNSTLFIDVVDNKAKQLRSDGSVIDLTAGATSGANTEQIVNSEADLPIAVSGVISLAANTNYVLGDNFSTVNRFDVSAGNVSWTSGNIFGPKITYTGGLTMFTGVDTTFNIFDAALDAPNAKLFDFSDVATPGVSIIQMDSVRCDTCDEWGTFDDCQALLIVNSSAGSIANGVEILGTSWVVLSAIKFALISGSATFIGIDLNSATFANAELVNLVMVGPPGAIGVSGITGSGNINTGSIGVFRDSSFIAGITPISGISVDDIRWSFNSNGGIPDTVKRGMVSLSGNVTETVIVSAGVPVKVAGTWVVEQESHFTADTTGRITYDGEVALNNPVDVVVTVRAASGTNKNVTAFVAVNGTVEANSGQVNQVDSSDPKQITLMWEVDFNQTNFIEVFVQNDTDTTNLIVNSGIQRSR